MRKSKRRAVILAPRLYALASQIENHSARLKRSYSSPLFVFVLLKASNVRYQSICDDRMLDLYIFYDCLLVKLNLMDDVEVAKVNKQEVLE